MTFQQKLDRVLPILIGLWRFRCGPGTPWNKSKWCLTWMHRGRYYDVAPCATPGLALDRAYNQWQALKRKQRHK